MSEAPKTIFLINPELDQCGWGSEHVNFQNSPRTGLLSVEYIRKDVHDLLMADVERRNNKQIAKLQLAKLLVDNPDLPIRLWVMVDNNPEHDSYLLLRFTGAKVVSLYIGDSCVYDSEDDALEHIEDELDESLSDEENLKKHFEIEKVILIEGS